MLLHSKSHGVLPKYIEKDILIKIVPIQEKGSLWESERLGDLLKTAQHKGTVLGQQLHCCASLAGWSWSTPGAAFAQPHSLSRIALLFKSTHLNPPLSLVLVQSLSRVRLFATPWIAAHQASLSTTNSQSLLKPMSIESMMPSSHLILCHHLLLLPPIPPSIWVFFNESTLPVRWPKYWSFNFNISPSNGHPGLMTFRMDWLDLLAVQGTLKILL